MADCVVKGVSKYDTRVRQAISDEYVRCSKERNKVHNTLIDLSQRLANEEDTLAYSEYLKLKEYYAKLETMHSNLTVEMDTWDKAREICLNIADDEFTKE